ncbi:hypothetical protein QR680_009458 [Steinernema hermaphroditum]|uniref:Peptidase S9 prolyl oligopeptidase catalytic domain-containing protein n=1 Tax=Steinernema hermaphroditum TaxID=289476 RepID=A0AA39IMS8_9BILA|nr:hypothetical protein QR680_009458 [Steinernema hermaphroditum]
MANALKDLDLLDGADEELVSGNPQERNWRGILTALLVISAMCSVIFAAVLILTPLTTEATSNRTRFGLDDIGSNLYSHQIGILEWVGPQRLFLKNYTATYVLDVAKSPPEKRLFADYSILYQHGKVVSMVVHPAAKFIALALESSFDGSKSPYRIFDPSTSTFEVVGPNRTGAEPIQLFRWNPKGDDFVFVHENNIFYQRAPSPTAEVLQLTNSDSAVVYNGVADWLYEEELYQSQQAMWWARSGEILAFVTIDDRHVRNIEFPSYNRLQYPAISRIPYPKADVKELPTVSLNMWRRSDVVQKRMEVQLAAPEGAYQYLMMASWVVLHGKDILVAVWANRYQNETSITLCDFDAGKCVLNFAMKYRMDGLRMWAESDDYRIRHSTDDAYFVILPHRFPDGNIYNHVARISVPKDYKNGREVFLASGPFDVKSIDGYDAATDTVFFTAAAPLPSQNQLFRASASPSPGESARCATCDVVKRCAYHATTFSANNDHFIMFCKGLGVPRVFIASVSGNFSDLFEVTDGETIAKNFEAKLAPTVVFENVTLRNGYVAAVKLFLPPGLKPNSLERRYPLLVDVYGGPNSQRVMEENSVSLSWYFSTSLEYVVAVIDGRGTGSRGWKYRSPIYGQLGTVEIEDQIEAARALLKKHRFLDRSRVAIWGWSYGGFASAHIVERDANRTFKCAISVAPVTNFKYYDATYTERYMGMADSTAYERTNLARNVTAFHSVNYLLVHGTGDDNVHFQNTAEFIRALTDARVQFDLMIYPDSRHSLINVRPHLHDLLIRFLQKCFHRIQ